MKPSAAIKGIIAELGLRYRPSAQADLEAHAALLALLVMDVADMPAHILRTVARQWARESHFMPKASDLIERCRAETMREEGTHDGSRDTRENVVRLANARNASLAAAGSHFRWTVNEQNQLDLDGRR